MSSGRLSFSSIAITACLGTGALQGACAGPPNAHGEAESASVADIQADDIAVLYPVTVTTLPWLTRADADVGGGKPTFSDKVLNALTTFSSRKPELLEGLTVDSLRVVAVRLDPKGTNRNGQEAEPQLRLTLQSFTQQDVVDASFAKFHLIYRVESMLLNELVSLFRSARLSSTECASGGNQPSLGVHRVLACDAKAAGATTTLPASWQALADALFLGVKNGRPVEAGFAGMVERREIEWITSGWPSKCTDFKAGDEYVWLFRGVTLDAEGNISPRQAELFDGPSQRDFLTTQGRYLGVADKPRAHFCRSEIEPDPGLEHLDAALGVADTDLVRGNDPLRDTFSHTFTRAKALVVQEAASDVSSLTQHGRHNTSCAHCHTAAPLAQIADLPPNASSDARAGVWANLDRSLSAFAYGGTLKRTEPTNGNDITITGVLTPVISPRLRAEVDRTLSQLRAQQPPTGNRH